MLRVKRRKKRASESRVTPPTPERRNHCWAMDFMSDNLYNGPRFRVLNVLDSYSRDYLGFEVDTSINGKRVCSVLDRIACFKGLPELITVDNGTEFIGNALDAWAHRHGVKLVFNRPGKPVDNTSIETFNDRLRDECLNVNWFLSLKHAREVIAEWQKDYNSILPHSSLGKQTPEEFLVQQTESCQKEVVYGSGARPQVRYQFDSDVNAFWFGEYFISMKLRRSLLDFSYLKPSLRKLCNTAIYRSGVLQPENHHATMSEGMRQFGFTHCLVLGVQS